MERRKCERFRVNGRAFVYYDSYSPKIAEISDVSNDGMSFTHVGISETVDKPLELEIILPDSIRFMEKLPCRTIADFKIFSDLEDDVGKRRCSVQFLDLSSEQRSKIEYFIENYCWRVCK